MLSSSELARTLGVSPGRVSQYVASGNLEGCFTGSGRQRRFDLERVAAALGKSLDPGQMLGNGAQTKSVLKGIVAGDTEVSSRAQAPVTKKTGSGATVLPPEDPDRYELARTQKAEEEARRIRRQNAEAEGLYVLSAEVSRSVAKMMAQEVAEVETVLRDGARKVADLLGIDFKQTRQILIDVWRDHRKTRSNQLALQSTAADLTDAEKAENI